MSKKITVAGIGGVGGYLQECWRIPMMEVSFIARGERKKVSKRMGLYYTVNITEK